MDLISTITLGAKGLLMASFLECNLVDFDELPADQQNFLENVITQGRIPDEDQALIDNNGNTYYLQNSEDGYVDWHIVNPKESVCYATPFIMPS